MNQHGATEEHGDGLINLGPEMDMDMLNSMPSAEAGDSLTQFHPLIYDWCNDDAAPWSSLTAAIALSEPPSTLHSGTNTGRTPAIPRNSTDLPSFMGYRLPQPALSECSTQPPVDRFTSDSGYGTVQSAARLSIANTSVFGDNNTDTQSLAGHLSNFDLQTNSLTPVETFYRRSHGDFVSGATAYGSQPMMQGPSPLTCPHCRDTFKTKSQLKKHMQRHDKMHFCKEPGCSRKEGFSTQNDLDRHKRSKHPATHATGRRYRCHLGACKNKPKKWPRADNFRQHLKRRHKDEVADDDLERFIVDENPPPANGMIDCGSNVDTETEYPGPGPLHVDLSDVGQDLRATENPQQVRWAAAEDTHHACVEDDFQHDMGEQPQLSLEVPFDAASMMVGGQFTVFSPTTPDSQDVNLNTIDNPPTVDFDFADPYTPPAASKRSPLTVENQGAMTPMFSSHPEDLGFNSHDPFHNHGGLYQEFSDPPRITIDMVEPDNDGSSLLNYDDPHRRSIDTLTDVYTHGDEDNISADDSISGDVDAPGEAEKTQHTDFFTGASCTQNSENVSGVTTQEGSGAVSPAATLLAEQVSQEKDQEGGDEHDDSSQTSKTEFVERLKAGGYDELLKKHGYQKHPPPPAAGRRRSSSQTSGAPSTELSGNAKCPAPGCSKTFNRECELRKHIRRHEKPYGCTFRYCTKKFGSKSDWKRHENSQHEHLDGWRCDILVRLPAGVATEAAVTTTQPCGKQCHRRETFKMHLQHHGLSEDQVAEKLEQCHYGKDCESRFWCGFCVAVVGVCGDGVKGISSKGGRKKAEDSGWSVRYDHIDDHLFGRTLPKKRIDQWRHDEMEGSAEVAVGAGMEEPRQKEDEIEANEDSEKKERERSGRRQRRAATKGDGPRPTHWQCVSGKYLDLTRQKLELTRLPHENSIARSDDSWEPKPAVEAVIDYWLDRFSWRDQEERFNTLPQFRTAISTDSALQAPQRIHFLHFRSPHKGAVPLLLIPPFPFTNLSVAHLGESLANPPVNDDDAAPKATPPIAFHVVIPSIPGLGFSDALPSNTGAVPATVEMLDRLMRRLEHPYYLASGTSSGVSSPARIDWLILERLALEYASSCLGVHMISPPLQAPNVTEAPVEFAKWSIASLFGAAILGYSAQDFAALAASSAAQSRAKILADAPTETPSRTRPSTLTKQRYCAQCGGACRYGSHHEHLGQVGLNSLAPPQDANTLAYALCDSPTGLLVYILKILRLLAGPGGGPSRTSTADKKTTMPPTSTVAGLTHDDVITIVNLAWLPGAEYALRFWSQAAARGEAEANRMRRMRNGGGKKPRVAVTVFLGGKNETNGQGSGTGRDTGENIAAGAVNEQGGEGPGARMAEASQSPNNDYVPLAELPELPAGSRAAPEPYVCPAWGNSRFEVIFAQRVSGKPGLLAWERPQIIVNGIRELAWTVVKTDKRLTATKPQMARLESVIIDDGKADDRERDRPTTATVQPESSAAAQITRETEQPTTAELSAAQVPSSPRPSSSRSNKGKGPEMNEMDMTTTTPPLPQKPEPARLSSTDSSPRERIVGLARIPEVEDDELLKPPPLPRGDTLSQDESSPDTLVVTTPPLGGTPPVVTSPLPPPIKRPQSAGRHSSDDNDIAQPISPPPRSERRLSINPDRPTTSGDSVEQSQN
ncbi:hypothetical protein PspLS_09218 [Pyricularia sp. CBS 133598]|nr:hypothetical protein PspLS_09218 [Pyricularia sp. CBS 133598]